MAENDFLVWAGASGANVLTQSAYAALSNLTTGDSLGLASSAQANKTWRQSSIIAAVIAQMIGDVTGQPVVDDGTTATIEANLIALIRSSGGLYVVDSGAANAIAVALTPAPASLSALVGLPLRVKLAASSTGAATINVNGLGAVAIQQNGAALGGGELVAGTEAVIAYNGAVFELISKSAGTVNVANATTSTQAVPLGQGDARYAALNGSASQPFTASNLTASTGVFSNTQAFTTSGTFTVPAGVTLVRAIVVGGGGGGANGSTVAVSPGGNYSSGGGGGAGGIAIGIYAVTPNQTIPVTIPTIASSQANGGTASFGSFCSAIGGAGSNFNTVLSSPGGSGGGGSGGNILNGSGAYGSDGQTDSFTGPGDGGDGPWGGRGRAYAGGNPATVANALGYGAGGGGCYASGAGANVGGSGGPGIVIVEW